MHQTSICKTLASLHHLLPLPRTVADDRTCSIVFVHGLGGHPKETWATHASSENTTTGAATPPAEKTSRLWRFRNRVARPKSDSKLSVGVVRDDLVFWPKDLLAKDLHDQPCRILTFGYDSRISQGYARTNQNNIFAHARDLLMELRRNRLVEKPVIFIAHSLGGIIVKEVFKRKLNSSHPSAKLF